MNSQLTQVRCRRSRCRSRRTGTEAPGQIAVRRAPTVDPGGLPALVEKPRPKSLSTKAHRNARPNAIRRTASSLPASGVMTASVAGRRGTGDPFHGAGADRDMCEIPLRVLAGRLGRIRWPAVCRHLDPSLRAAVRVRGETGKPIGRDQRPGSSGGSRRRVSAGVWRPARRPGCGARGRAWPAATGDVVLHGLLGEEEPLADLAVGQPLGDQGQDLALPLGQRAELVGASARRAQPLQHPRGHGRVEQRLAGGDPADRVDQVGAADLLQHVAGGARHDRGEQRLVVVVRGEDDALIAGSLERIARQTSMPLPSGSRASRIATSGRSAGMIRIGLLRRPVVADHVEVVLGLEQVAQSRRTISWSSSRNSRILRVAAGSTLPCSQSAAAHEPIDSTGDLVEADLDEEVAGARRPRHRVRLAPQLDSSSALAAARDSAGTSTLQPVGSRGSKSSISNATRRTCRRSASGAVGRGPEDHRVVVHRVGDRQDRGPSTVFQPTRPIVAGRTSGPALVAGRGAKRRSVHLHRPARPPNRAARSSRGSPACPRGARRRRSWCSASCACAPGLQPRRPAGVRLALLIASITRW